ncbi:MAG: hypothetical protein ACREC9_10780 [Methylocella sp.]
MMDAVVMAGHGQLKAEHDATVMRNGTLYDILAAVYRPGAPARTHVQRLRSHA